MKKYLAGKLLIPVWILHLIIIFTVMCSLDFLDYRDLVSLILPLLLMGLVLLNKENAVLTEERSGGVHLMPEFLRLTATVLLSSFILFVLAHAAYTRYPLLNPWSLGHSGL